MSRRAFRRFLPAAAALVATAALLWQPAFVLACALAEDAQAYQPSVAEMREALESAARGQLGAAYPPVPKLEAGHPTATPISAEMPCAILKSIAWIEGAWQQAAGSVAEGATGPVKRSGSCGYGAMQITSGMRNPGDLPPDTQQRIGGDYRYNVAWGAQLLAEKWNAGDFFGAVVGDRNPSVGEHWYYAVWAYNQFNFRNNPNNPDYPANRPAFDGTQSKANYPYQELVWGYMANPPKRGGVALWTPVALGLPDRSLVGQTPGPLPRPAAPHPVTCLTAASPPLDRRFFFPHVSKRAGI